MLTETSVRTTKLPSGEAVPVLGQGTWHLAEGRHRDEEEVQALRVELDLGMTLHDTAEMYAEGGVEELGGEAIEGSVKSSVDYRRPFKLAAYAKGGPSHDEGENPPSGH